MDFDHCSYSKWFFTFDPTGTYTPTQPPQSSHGLIISKYNQPPEQNVTAGKWRAQRRETVRSDFPGSRKQQPFQSSSPPRPPPELNSRGRVLLSVWEMKCENVSYRQNFKCWTFSATRWRQRTTAVSASPFFLLFFFTTFTFIILFR